MGIFVGAALAGFFLFGGIQASPRVLKVCQKSWVQGVLGVLVLIALVGSFGSLMTLQKTYPSVRIIQALTGPEVRLFILGALFGCILRYWGTDLWALTIEKSRTSNYMAIGLVGLLLLAASMPYIERQLDEWIGRGLTSLKTPFAELQFSRTTRARIDAFIFKEQISTRLPSNGSPPSPATFFYIQPDLDYLRLFRNDPYDEKSKERQANYRKSLEFGNVTLDPLHLCAYHAYNSYLDIESIRHELRPVAQKLRILIQQGLVLRSLGSNSSENQDDLEQNFTSSLQQRTEFRVRVRDSISQLKQALVGDEEKNECKLDKSIDEKAQSENQKTEKFFPMDPRIKKTLADSPHIYLALALLDEYNGNEDGAISILKLALERFGDDRDLSPWILFNINYTLGLLLADSEHDLESIFKYLDDALEIAQDTLGKIDKQKENAILQIIEKRRLYRVAKEFEFAETLAKNSIAYISAQKGVRKFEAFQYAKENYDMLEKLTGWMRSKIIDTYGYVKMVFATSKVPPNFYEIGQAVALFREALFHVNIAPEQNRTTIEIKHYANKIIRAHLEQANGLLEND